jgi:hypothetical protein
MKKIGTAFALVVGFSMQIACTIEGAPEGNVPAPDREQPPAQQGDQPKPGATNPPANLGDPMANPPKPKSGMAMVRAIHGSPNAPAVDVYVKGNPTPVVTNLSYGQTSGWLEVPEGKYDFELRAAPSKPSDPIAYQTGALTVPAGAMISAIAAGLLGSMDADAAFRILPVVENFDEMAPGKARVRAIHAGADAPSVDLDVGNDNPAAPEVKLLERYKDTGADGVLLPAGSALAIGIAKDGGRVTSFTTPKLPAGSNLLVIATGLLAKLPREKDGFALLAVGGMGSVGFIKQDPTVYALHASPDAPTVDVFVGPTEIIDNLRFGALSKPIQVQPGEYTLDFYGYTTGSTRPAGSPAASASTGKLEAGERYLAAADGFLTKGTFKLLGFREGFDQNANKSVLRAVHGSPDAPAVDIGLLENGSVSTVLFKDLKFTTASAENGLQADAGHIPVGVAATGSSTPVAGFTVPATNGQRAFVIAAGALAPATGQKAFRLAIVDTAPSPWTVTHVVPH